MATHTQIPLTPIGVKDGPVRKYSEAAGQSFLAGSNVYLNGGKVTAFEADGASLLGKACKAATGTTDADCYVIPIVANGLLMASVTHSNPSSAVTAVAQIGELYSLSAEGYVNIEGTGSNKNFRVVEGGYQIEPGQAVGDQYGTVVGYIASTALQCPFNDISV